MREACKERPFLLLSAMMIAFYIGTRLSSSWFQLYDDFEIFNGIRSLRIHGILDTIRQWLHEDIFFTGRFRPFYWVHRTIEIFLFAARPLLWSLYTYLLGIASTFFFYAALRRAKISAVVSGVSAACFFFGSQTAIWWRLGPAETLGSFFFSWAFYLTLSGTYRSSGKYLLLLITTLLAVLSKETFVFALPWLCLAGFLRSESSLLHYLWEERRLCIGLFLVACISVSGVYFALSNAVGYAAGYGPSVGAFARTLFDAMSNGWLAFALIVIVLAWLTEMRLKQALKLLGVMSAMVVPQLLVYMQSGLSERYLLPFIYGPLLTIAFAHEAFFTVKINWKLNPGIWIVPLFVTTGIFWISGPPAVLSRWFERPQDRLLSLLVLIMLIALMGKKSWLQKLRAWIWPSATVIVLSTQMMGAYHAAVDYRDQGIRLNTWLNLVAEHSGDEKRVLLAVDPIWHYQWGLSLNFMLPDMQGVSVDNLYFQHEPGSVGSIYDRHTYVYYQERFPAHSQALDAYKVIIVPKVSEQQFIEQTKAQNWRSGFTRKDIGDFVFVAYLR